MQVLAAPRLLVSADELGTVTVSHLPWPADSPTASPWPAFSLMLDADLQVLMQLELAALMLAQLHTDWTA